MKTKTVIIVMTILFLFSLMLFLGSLNIAGAKEPSERFKGYNKQRDKWVVGNLGKAYVECDFVSYQLRIDTASKMWGAAEFSISFNFHQRSSGAIYVDGFDTSEETGFQWSTNDFLPDGQPTPSPSWGTHIPTPEAGETWISGPNITNYMDAWPPGTGDGTPAGSYPAKERYFTVSGMPWESATTHIILFFRAHLALNVVWSEGLEADLPTELDGDEFEDWTDSWHGASFATGSSRHFYLQVEGVGDKTIPIPMKIREYVDLIVSKNVTYTSCRHIVSGAITINNPNPAIVVVYATILDEVWDDGVLKGSQDLTPEGPILIPSGVSTYDYSITLTETADVGKPYTNRVTVELTELVRTYYAEVTFYFT